MMKIVVIPLVLLGLLIAYIQFEAPILVFWLNNTNDGLSASIAMSRLATLKEKSKILAQLENQNSAARLFAIRTLAATQEAELWTYLPQLCNDPDKEVRDAAVIASGNLKIKGSVPAIINYYNDGWADRTTRGMAMTRNAITALIQIAHPSKKVVKILEGSVANDVYKDMMVKSFVQAPNKRFLPLYEKMLRHSTHHERIEPVIKLVAKYAGKASAAKIHPCLNSKVPKVRIRAVKTLVKLKDKSAVAPMKKRLKKEKDKSVKAALKKAIKSLSA